MSVLRELGIRPVINATGPWTRMGNSAPSAEIRAVMNEIGGTFVPIAELQDIASRTIAEVTGSEAGYVTSGAASAITLSVAACVAGEDPERINGLPKIQGSPDTVVMFEQSRWFYDVAVRAVGVKLRTVDALADYALERLVEAIDDDVACVFHDCTGRPYRDPTGVPPVTHVIDAAHQGGVPIVVDASMALPPQSNITDIVTAGADAVAFSGGKALKGPAASGFVACRKRLVRSMALQQQDLNIWTELTGEIDPNRSFMGLGRSHKVGKEEIVGLIMALKSYVAQDQTALRTHWNDQLTLIENAISDLDGVTTRWENAGGELAPYLLVKLAGDPSFPTPSEVSSRLLASEPRIFIAAHRGDTLWIGPETLQEGDAEIVAKSLRETIQNWSGAQ